MNSLCSDGMLKDTFLKLSSRSFENSVVSNLIDCFTCRPGFNGPLSILTNLDGEFLA
ncbi:MAG: hypothetical protein HN553_04825 [Opitutae bacterium]|nr:hypothetical protein [Opitutae bacterium]